MLKGLWTGLAVCVLAVSSFAVDRFAPDERVVFFGDSITHGGHYLYYLQLFQDLRHPGRGTRILNGGISGDSAYGAVRRFADDVKPMRPDRAFVMFGMNDVGRDLYATTNPTPAVAQKRAQTLDGYAQNQRRLADVLSAAGIKTVLLTPSPYDQYSPMGGKTNLVACNDPGLAACARIVRELAAERHLDLVDLHAPLTRLAAAHPDHPFCGDRVHPGPEGHLLMAAHILDALGCSEPVARVGIELDAGKGILRDACNVTVTALDTASDYVAFTYAPRALPFPKLPEYGTMDGAFYPLTEKFNREMLVVKGLAAGSYRVAFDGAVVGTFTAAALAQGVNLALLDTPGQRRAQAAAQAMKALQGVESRLRTFALVCLKLRREGVDPEDRAASEAHLAAWLARERSSRWIKSFENWATTYRTTGAVRADLLREVKNLRAQMGAVRPVISRVTVVPAR